MIFLQFFKIKLHLCAHNNGLAALVGIYPFLGVGGHRLFIRHRAP